MTFVIQYTPKIKCAICDSLIEGELSSYDPCCSYCSSPDKSFLSLEFFEPKVDCVIYYCPVCHYCAPSIGEEIRDFDGCCETDEVSIDKILRMLEEDDEDVSKEKEDKFVKERKSVINVNAYLLEKKCWEKREFVAETLSRLIVPSPVCEIDDEFCKKFLDLSRFCGDFEKERGFPHEVNKDKLVRILKSKEYELLVECMEYIDSSIGYLIYAYICDKFRWFSTAGWYAMCCARKYCDPRSFLLPFLQEEFWKPFFGIDAARLMKKLALNFFIRSVLSGRNFSETLVSEGFVLIDISRTLGEFDLASRFLQLLEEAISKYRFKLYPIQKSVIQYQKMLIEKRDEEEYFVNRAGNIFSTRRRRKRNEF